MHADRHGERAGAVPGQAEISRRVGAGLAGEDDFFDRAQFGFALPKRPGRQRNARFGFGTEQLAQARAQCALPGADFAAAIAQLLFGSVHQKAMALGGRKTEPLRGFGSGVAHGFSSAWRGAPCGRRRANLHESPSIDSFHRDGSSPANRAVRLVDCIRIEDSIKNDFAAIDPAFRVQRRMQAPIMFLERGLKPAIGTKEKAFVFVRIVRFCGWTIADRRRWHGRPYHDSNARTGTRAVRRNPGHSRGGLPRASADGGRAASAPRRCHDAVFPLLQGRPRSRGAETGRAPAGSLRRVEAAAAALAKAQAVFRSHPIRLLRLSRFRVCPRRARDRRYR
ncbi:MAG: hypothetical protein BWZ10_02813 [candidate division BRC1 bacterium ADurb.BinA364]|nr:MAG: hypothetical protein BWZ10_02813 [candidate division BRC1 bacterium ADurb.BinA364]